MSEEQQFCLRWNNFQANITSQFEALRDEEDFVDVTLACDGQRLKAHKVVLSACSPYFKELFKSNPCKHPILFLRDVAFNHLRALVEFMYAGEVNVAQAQLPAFLRTAESLQIRGLTEAPQKHKQSHPRHQQTQPAPQSVPPSLTSATAVAATQETAEEADPSSPECIGVDDDDDEEALSMSPQVVASPPPPKRPCLPQNSASDTHSNPATSLEEVAASVKESTGGFIEPKLELPDYGSDGESKTNTATFLGLDSNSVDVNTSFAAALQSGGMEIIPGPSGQNFLGESSATLDPGQVDHRKLHSLDPRPCPICNRMYSNLSNLRQHVRLIHNPQIVMCPLCGKPFKTKLYLKRHLNSFHELLCNNSGGNKQMAGNDFYPPSPQVYLEADGNKVSTDGVVKGKDQNAADVFQAPRGGMGRAANPNERITGFPNMSKNKDVRIAQDAYQNSRGYYPSMQHFEDKSKSKSLDLFQMPRLFQSVMNPPHSLHANKENKSGYPVVSKSKDQQQSPEIYQSTSGYQSALDSVENSGKNNYQQQQQAKIRDLQQNSDFLQASRCTTNISQSGSIEKQKELYQGYDGDGNAFSGNDDDAAVQIKEDKTSNGASEGSSYIGDLSLASGDSSRLVAQQQLPGNGIAEGLTSFLDQPTNQNASGFIHETFAPGDNRSPVDSHESGN